LAAVLCWVVYTQGAGELRGWSPLRFTALSAAAGAVGLVLLAAAGALTGISPLPSLDDYAATAPGMAYMVALGAVFSVVAWTVAVRGLGPQRAALFGNLVPVVTFTVTIVMGTHPLPLEIAGTLLTLGALAGDNLAGTRALVARTA